MTGVRRAIHTAIYTRVATTLGYTAYTGVVPQAPTFPAVVLSGGPEMRSDEASDKDGEGSRTVYSLRVDSLSPLEAMDVAKAIVDSLTTTDLSVTGHDLLKTNLMSQVPLPSFDAELGTIYSENIDVLFITVPS